MGGPPPGGGSMQQVAVDMKDADVWSVLEKILGGKDANPPKNPPSGGPPPPPGGQQPPGDPQPNMVQGQSQGAGSPYLMQ